MEEVEDQEEFDRAAAAACSTRFDHEVAILEQMHGKFGVGSKIALVDSAVLGDLRTKQVAGDHVASHAAAPREQQNHGASLVGGVCELGLAAGSMLKLCRSGVDDTLEESQTTSNSVLVQAPGRKKTVKSGKSLENSQTVVVAAAPAGAFNLSTGIRTGLKSASRRRFCGSGLLEVLDWHHEQPVGDGDAGAGHEVMMSSDRRLKERVMSLSMGEEEQEAPARLDYRIRSFESMKAMEVVFSDKVNEVEMHVDGLRKRLERAEGMIADLCKHSADEDGRGLVATSTSHAVLTSVQTDLEELRYVCAHKDEEKRLLQELVDGLQELCMNHDRSIHGLRQALKYGSLDAAAGSSKLELGKMNSELQRELYRLSDLEAALRSELEVARRETTLLRFENKALVDSLRRGGTSTHEIATRAAATSTRSKLRLDQEFHSQLYRGQAQLATTSVLQEKYDLLASRLRLVMKHRRSAKEFMRESEAKLAQVGEDNKSLRLELARARRSLRARENDVHNLENQVEAITASNHILQATLSLRDKTAAACGLTVNLQQEKGLIAPGAVMNEWQQVDELELLKRSTADNQLQSVSLEAVMRKRPQNTSSGPSKKEPGLIPSMENTLLELTSIVSTQNSCVARLATQNEELARASQLQLQHIEDLLQNATAIKRKERAAVGQFKEQLAIETYWRPKLVGGLITAELDDGYELETASKCEMLQEYVVTLEEDLRQSQAHCTLLLQEQEELSLERYELLCSLADAYLRLSELEKELNERVELMKELETDLDKSTHEVQQKSKELALVTKERDESRKEGENMGREALHMSLELELLKRRLRQLDEELLLKDGQISILRSSNWGDDDDEFNYHQV